MTPFKAGLIALVVVIVGCYLGFTKSIPFKSQFLIKADFRSSNQIKPHSPVRIAGVQVGEVKKVQPTSPGADSAVVTMSISDNGRPIHADATAKIRPRIFLEGNFFVDLTTGSPSAPVLGNGDTIPASQTATPVQFDQVLKALTAPTRKETQLTISEFSRSFKRGLARNINRSLADQTPAYKYSAIVLEALLGREPHDLSNVVRDVGTTSAALDRSPPALQSLLVNFDRTASAVAVQSSNLRAAVHELPRTLAAAGPALDALNASFPPTRRFAALALPGVKSSLPAVNALEPFIAQGRKLVSKNELRGLTADLRAATPPLVQVSTKSLPLLDQLRSFSACTVNTVLPWSHETVPDKAFPATGPVYQEAVKWLPGLAGESRSFDANGQWFKVLGSGGAETFQLGNGVFGSPLLPIEGVNPPKQNVRPPLNENAPCEDQAPPNLATIPQGPPATTKTSPITPLVRQRLAKAKQSAEMVAAEAFRESGDPVKSTLKDATESTVQALARSTGHVAQLRVLREGLPLTHANIRKAGGR
jgi:phospholipid/cholesterol/gamma-HCH transport system substrate-binding protein